MTNVWKEQNTVTFPIRLFQAQCYVLTSSGYSKLLFFFFILNKFYQLFFGVCMCVCTCISLCLLWTRNIYVGLPNRGHPNPAECSHHFFWSTLFSFLKSVLCIGRLMMDYWCFIDLLWMQNKERSEDPATSPDSSFLPDFSQKFHWEPRAYETADA